MEFDLACSKRYEIGVRACAIDIGVRVGARARAENLYIFPFAARRAENFYIFLCIRIDSPPSGGENHSFQSSRISSMETKREMQLMQLSVQLVVQERSGCACSGTDK